MRGSDLADQRGPRGPPTPASCVPSFSFIHLIPSASNGQEERMNKQFVDNTYWSKRCNGARCNVGFRIRFPISCQSVLQMISNVAHNKICFMIFLGFLRIREGGWLIRQVTRNIKTKIRNINKFRIAQPVESVYSLSKSKDQLVRKKLSLTLRRNRKGIKYRYT